MFWPRQFSAPRLGLHLISPPRVPQKQQSLIAFSVPSAPNAPPICRASIWKGRQRVRLIPYLCLSSLCYNSPLGKRWTDLSPLLSLCNSQVARSSLGSYSKFCLSLAFGNLQEQGQYGAKNCWVFWQSLDIKITFFKIVICFLLDSKCLLWAMCQSHTCNPSYSVGSDQEDCGSKPAWANSSQDPISKNPAQKKGWWSGSRCRPWVQAPVLKKKNASFGFWILKAECWNPLYLYSHYSIDLEKAY
jgi:hypothetical protein